MTATLEVNEPLPPLDQVKLRRIDTLQDANDFMSWLSERRPWLATDTETTGLNIMKDRVRLVQFGDVMQGWTIPWENGWAGLIKEVFARWRGRYLFHNGPYDVAMLSNSCGIQVPLHMIDDTMHAAHCLDSTRSVALKILGQIHVDRNAAVAQAMLEHAMTQNNWTWATIPIEVPAYGVYAGMDTVLTARLGADIMPQVRSICPSAYDLELAFAWVVMRMKMRGAYVDLQYTQEALVKFKAYAEQLAAYCMTNFGVLPNKSQDVIRRCQEDGLVFTQLTDGGALSLDKDVLKEQIAATNHPLLVAVQKHRQTAYLSSHYLNVFPKFADENGLMRADMFSLGARTGRMSIRDPALQTLPRRSEANPLAITVRNCIRSRYEKGYLGLCDWDQIEMRMMAHLSQDAGLRHAFMSGDDFFNATARAIYGDPSIVKGDIRRQRTKNGMYAKAYGAGAAKFGLTVGIPFEEAEAFMAGLDQSYPGIRRFQNEVGRSAALRQATEGRAYVTSPITGRRHYADPGKEYALTNYLIQGTAAEILKLKAVQVDAAGVDNLILLVHDEMIADCRDKAEALETKRVLEEVMNDSELLSVPLTASTEFGVRWGDKGSVKLTEEA